MQYFTLSGHNSSLYLTFVGLGLAVITITNTQKRNEGLNKSEKRFLSADETLLLLPASMTHVVKNERNEIHGWFILFIIYICTE